MRNQNTPVKAPIVGAVPSQAKESARSASQSLANFDDLPRSAYVRVAALCQVVPFSIPTAWRKSRDGTFPAPVKLSLGVTAWNVGSIRDWLATQASA